MTKPKDMILKLKMKNKYNRWSVAFYEPGGGWFSYNCHTLIRALFFALLHIGKVESINKIGR